MIDTSRLEPGIRAWLARLAELEAEVPPLIDPTDMTARRAREFVISERLAAEFVAPVDPRAEITEVDIAGRPAHLIRPAGVSASLPTQVFLHGGGFVSGTARERINDALLSERAVRAGIQIVSLDYRLAPEHPYPAAVEDTLAALAALHDEAGSWRADPERLGVGGASAGGHIAAVVCLRARDARRAGGDLPPLVHALLEVPALDLGFDWPSIREFAGPGEVEGALAVRAAYLGQGEPDGYVNPARVDDLTHLPRTLVMTAEFDALRDPAEEYARRLGEAATLRRAVGQLHATAGLTRPVDSSRAWQDAAIAELRAAYAPSSPDPLPRSLSWKEDDDVPRTHTP